MRTLMTLLAIAACDHPRPDLSGEAPFEPEGPAWLHKEALPLPGDSPPKAAEGSACAGVLEMLPKIEARMKNERAPDPVLDAIDRCFERLGRVPELVAFYGRARAAAPDDSRWITRQAGAFVTLGDAAEAMRLLSGAPPDDPAALFLQGLILASEAPKDPVAKRGARDAWRRLMEVDPEHTGLDAIPPAQIRARVARWSRELGESPAPPPASAPAAPPAVAPPAPPTAAPSADPAREAPSAGHVAAPPPTPAGPTAEAVYAKAMFQAATSRSRGDSAAAKTAYLQALEAKPGDPAATSAIREMEKKKPAEP